MRTKTTLELEKNLYLQLKALAAKEGKTLKKVMDEIIVLGLNSRNNPGQDSKFAWPEGKNLAPLVDLNDKSRIQSILDEGD